MSKLNVNGNIDILVKDEYHNVLKEDYSDWISDRLSSNSLITDLSSEQVEQLNSEIAKQMSANVYYLTMRTKDNYSIYIKDMKFGCIYDIVDSSNMEGRMRCYYVRLDLVTSHLLNKYPNDIVSISKLLQKADFEIKDNSIFQIGDYCV